MNLKPAWATDITSKQNKQRNKNKLKQKTKIKQQEKKREDKCLPMSIEVEGIHAIPATFKCVWVHKSHQMTRSSDEAGLLPIERGKLLVLPTTLTRASPSSSRSCFRTRRQRASTVLAHTFIFLSLCHVLEYSHKITNKQLMATVQKQCWHHGFIPHVSSRLERLKCMGFSPQIESESKT